jgi:hypothetical protein
MAFKMKGMSFGEGTGSPNKKIYGTSSRDLADLSFEERSDYRNWKKSERQAGRKGAHHDNTYEAYLRSKNTNKKKKRSGKRLGIGDWLRKIFTPKRGGGEKLLPSTIAERTKYEDFLGGKKV